MSERGSEAERVRSLPLGTARLNGAHTTNQARPTPSGHRQRAVHYILHCRQLNLKCREKEPFRQLVENKPRVSRKS